MVSAMQTLVAVVNKHGCRHAAADSVTYDEGIACGEITNDKMRPFLKNISHDPNARHLIPKNPAEEERLYNSNPAYKKASDEHDEFSEAFQAVYPAVRGGRENSPVYLSDADYAAFNDVLNQVQCPLLPAKPVYYDHATQRVVGCLNTFQEGSENYKKLDDAIHEVMRNIGLRMSEYAARYPTGGRTRRIGPLKKGKLTDLGYHPSRKATSRHRALSKAVQKYGRTSTLRKVNAVAVLTKRRAPLTSRKYRADIKYLQKRYF